MMMLYKKITRRGELYQFQLRDNLLVKLPLIIHGGSSIKLNALTILTPSGALNVNANINWPSQGFLVPEDVGQLIKQTNMQLHADISKPLLNELIQMGSSSAYLVTDLSEESKAKLLDLEGQLDFTVRQNQILIGELMQSDQLDKESGLNLIILQSNLGNLDDYLAEIRDLLLNKKISLGVSYLLYWQNAQVYQLYKLLEKKVDSYQIATAKSLRAEWNSFVKQGLIMEDNHSYIISLKWERGALTSNGHALK